MAAAIVLPSVLDLGAAEALQARLLEARGRPLSLDASAVERLGGLALQVLLAARRAWAADGQPLAFEPVSDAFADQWSRFGAPALSGDLL